MSMRDMRRFVEGLLRQRRGRRMNIDPEQDAELRTAILLRSARVGAGAVREEFVSALHQRLSAELGAQTPARVPVARRRRFVQLTATAAASATVGACLDHLLVNRPATEVQPAPPGEVSGPTLSPTSGIWHVVASSADLPEGGVLRFDVGSVNGFVRRTGGTVAAVSGVCTHLGCKLNLDAPAKRLNCPCHGASFAVNGAVVMHRLPVPLAPLPQVTVREMDGTVQVFAPGN
jgi:cytochrome b6-f complex iron-sulfur subunit